jgi:hypothetical protein
VLLFSADRLARTEVAECWRMFDSMRVEVEVLDFLQCLITAIKPDLKD